MGLCCFYQGTRAGTVKSLVLIVVVGSQVPWLTLQASSWINALERWPKGSSIYIRVTKESSFGQQRKFNHELLLFEKLTSERSRDAIKSELQTLKVLVENTSQEFVDCLNLATDMGDISTITSKQQNLHVSWEGIRSKALHGLDYLDLRDETKSNSSRRSRRSNFSQRSAKSN